MDKSLKLRATAVANDFGFSSLQEIIRVILYKLANRELTISIKEEEVEHLSPRAERRYAKIIAEIKKGKNVTKTKNLDELFDLLKK